MSAEQPDAWHIVEAFKPLVRSAAVQTQLMATSASLKQAIFLPTALFTEPAGVQTLPLENLTHLLILADILPTQTPHIFKLALRLSTGLESPTPDHHLHFDAFSTALSFVAYYYPPTTDNCVDLVRPKTPEALAAAVRIVAERLIATASSPRSMYKEDLSSSPTFHTPGASLTQVPSPAASNVTEATPQTAIWFTPRSLPTQDDSTSHFVAKQDDVESEHDDDSVDTEVCDISCTGMSSSSADMNIIYTQQHVLPCDVKTLSPGEMFESPVLGRPFVEKKFETDGRKENIEQESEGRKLDFSDCYDVVDKKGESFTASTCEMRPEKKVLGVTFEDSCLKLGEIEDKKDADGGEKDVEVRECVSENVCNMSEESDLSMGTRDTMTLEVDEILSKRGKSETDTFVAKDEYRKRLHEDEFVGGVVTSDGGSVDGVSRVSMTDVRANEGEKRKKVIDDSTFRFSQRGSDGGVMRRHDGGGGPFEGGMKDESGEVSFCGMKDHERRTFVFGTDSKFASGSSCAGVRRRDVRGGYKGGGGFVRNGCGKRMSRGSLESVNKDEMIGLFTPGRKMARMGDITLEITPEDVRQIRKAADCKRTGRVNQGGGDGGGGGAGVETVLKEIVDRQFKEMADLHVALVRAQVECTRGGVGGWISRVVDAVVVVCLIVVFVIVAEQMMQKGYGVGVHV